MYSWAVKEIGNPRAGSVVSVPLPVGDSIKVVVMWDDDYTFQTFEVSELQAVAMDEVQKKPNLFSIDGGGGETTH